MTMVLERKPLKRFFLLLLIWELVKQILVWNFHWEGWIFLQIQIFYLHIYLGSTHYQWWLINGKNELNWIHFVKSKFDLNKHIQWHCMQLELNWIYILKISSNTLNGIQMWLNLNLIEKKWMKIGANQRKTSYNSELSLKENLLNLKLFDLNWFQWI